MKYYGYYRVSTSTQVEKGNGLDTQRQEIEKYAAANGIEIEEFFHDDGISGTVEERDGLTDLLAAMEKGDKVVVLNTSRLWRNDTVKVFVHMTLKKLKADIVSIESPNYTIYSNDPTEVLFNGIMELLDQYTRLEINMKLAKGRRAKANRGQKACGAAPIGYRWDNKQIVVDSDNSNMIEDIFVTYVDMKSLEKLRLYCNGKGYTTAQGKEFSKQALKNILNNDFYLGVVTHDGKKLQGEHPAIINQELFNKANDILSR